MTRIAAWVLAAMAAGMCVPARADLPDPAVLARWIQFAPNATDPARPDPQILARALTSGATCPSLSIDGQPATLAPRFTPDPPTDLLPMPVGRFPVLECEAVIPAAHHIATIGGADLKLPIADPKRILVIADTGCRMNGKAQQDCQDPVAFPLGLLASYESLFHPDLIVHVGDYFYRDTGCPDGATAATCPNTRAQWGDNWASWDGDFFGPASQLLAEAPWVMTRGNHESCGRGAQGWYHLLDPRPYDAAAPGCKKGSAWDFSPTYVVPAGSVDFLVHDSSFANDAKVDESAAKKYEADLRHVLDVLGDRPKPAIFMTHKPTYGLVRGAPDSAGNETEQYLFDGLFGGAAPPRIALFLSGHIHQAQYVNFVDSTKFAPQLVVGVGGSLLDDSIMVGTPRYDLAPGTKFDFVTGPDTTSTAPITGGHAQAEFGFAVLDATDTGFLARVYTISGQQSGRCVITLSPRKLDCAF